MDALLDEIVEALGRLSTEDGVVNDMSIPRYGAPEKSVKKAARQLGEKNIRLIREIIRTIGLTSSRALLEQTLQTLASGGIQTVDGSRKRTAGGTFFYLAREFINPATYRKLMASDKRKRRQHATSIGAIRSRPSKKRDLFVSGEEHSNKKIKKGALDEPLCTPR